MEEGGQTNVNKQKIVHHITKPGHKKKIEEHKAKLAAALLAHPTGANSSPAVLSQTPTVISGNDGTVAPAVAPSVAPAAPALPSAVRRRSRWGPSVPVAVPAPASTLQQAAPTAAASRVPPTGGGGAFYSVLPPTGGGGSYYGAVPPVGGGGGGGGTYYGALPPVGGLGGGGAYTASIPPLSLGGSGHAVLPPLGGAGRAQQACERVGCHNNKMLDCTYGFCMLCCTSQKRTPRCQVNRHYSRNTHS